MKQMPPASKSSNPWDDEDDAPKSPPMARPKAVVAPLRPKTAAKTPTESDLFITGFRKEDGKISFGLSLASSGGAKWGLDENYWYNASIWFNLEKLHAFLKGDDTVAKNIGRGRIYDPKSKRGA